MNLSRNERLENNPNLNKKSIQIVSKILSQNDLKAQELREKYKQLGVYVINLMSSPGSGKTTLLESLSRFKDFRFCVLEGDLQTNRDAQRLQEKGVSAYQITTGEACHLEAAMIESALYELQKQCDVSTMDYLFIENVGNLVCPASYDVGAHLNIVLLSSPEGDDKILKYPTMFMCADAVIVSKADMMEYFSFHLERVKDDLAQLKADVPLFLTSAQEIESIAKVRDFIVQKRAQNYQSQHQF
ncbi:hydrogenase nickel incorporation protein HypB [Helicobacter sp. MIT 21-1697]|uniref:hydrogenase nickel incorporation protein HypB n=1 Tax=Helicobacter sp. MIT 21-1697 TaxID=2993733 RepID=UPI00224B56CB|nr:hydrogenase nickel incorporation protein HypB [Helicobacter sp. MIT 21-1697]MCX2717376.1 hydrogenase nickel incorporation protein HypB [Helicobacter sp. MIT 21-1697]